MIKFLKRDWGWKSSGLALSFIMIIAIISVKPIGVSTQFVIFDGIIYNFFNKELIVKNQDNNSYSSTNHYLDRNNGDYAKKISNPINYSFVFIFSMILGGYIASKLHFNSEVMRKTFLPPICNAKPENLKRNRYILAFLGGILVLFGARLANGCTSGHMMSGMIQTSISGYLFALGAFSSAIIMSLILYKREN